MTNKLITGYWEGYIEHNVPPYPLSHIPEDVNIIPIAFIAPTTNNTWEWGIASSVYDSDTLFNCIDDINNRGLDQKVLFSLMDTPTVHWNDIDLDAFAKNVADTVNTKGLGGVDIDAESGMPQNTYVSCFIGLIKSLRKYLNNDKIITYTCYTESNLDKDILTEVADDIDILHTMSYFSGLNGMRDEFDFYGRLVGYDKVSIGVGVDQTSLSEVKQIAKTLNKFGYNKMMLWSLTQDVNKLTGKPTDTWLHTITENL